MKFASSALAALSATSFLAPGAGAIELDVKNRDSIIKAAGVAAAGLRKWYTGDRPGDVPGNLPDPYYWWECGAMFNAFVDYWYYTGDTQYNNITTQAMEHQIGSYNAFMPPNQTKTLGNDDQAFWGMAAMSAAENKLPDLPDDKPSWLALAQAVFNTQAARWDTGCAGGLKWQIYTFNNGYNYKNTISNGCFFNLGARLYKYTGNTTYMDWAIKAWDWEQAIGLMTSEYHYYDGTDDRQNCTKIQEMQWTYNAGVHMAGAAALWNATGDAKWEERLRGIIKGTDIFFQNDIMYEVACERNGKCNVDQRSFKAYLSRWMGYTMVVAPFTRDLLMNRLTLSAQAAAKQCNAGDDQSTCGLRWTNNGVNDGSFGVGEQMAAMEVMQNLLIDEVPGPVTEKQGGISKSDPSAGGDAEAEPITFDDITTGDKAGAGILTTIVLVGICAGGWWVIS